MNGFGVLASWGNSVVGVGIMLLAPAVAAVADEPRCGQGSELREKLVGCWTIRSFGRQTLTAYEDGSAQLVVKPSRLAALRYGRQMTLELEWTVEDGMLRHCIAGGSPERCVERLRSDFGDTFEYRIVEVRRTHALLSDVRDAEKEYRWESVPGESGVERVSRDGRTPVDTGPSAVSEIRLATHQNR